MWSNLIVFIISVGMLWMYLIRKCAGMISLGKTHSTEFSVNVLGGVRLKGSAQRFSGSNMIADNMQLVGHQWTLLLKMFLISYITSPTCPFPLSRYPLTSPFYNLLLSSWYHICLVYISVYVYMWVSFYCLFVNSLNAKCYVWKSFFSQQLPIILCLRMGFHRILSFSHIHVLWYVYLCIPVYRTIFRSFWFTIEFLLGS